MENAEKWCAIYEARTLAQSNEAALAEHQRSAESHVWGHEARLEQLKQSEVVRDLNEARALVQLQDVALADQRSAESQGQAHEARFYQLEQSAAWANAERREVRSANARNGPGRWRNGGSVQRLVHRVGFVERPARTRADGSPKPSRRLVVLGANRNWLELPDKGSPNHLSEVENHGQDSIVVDH
ncbi:hypothetical protein THAOC_14995, partial [Thalassiosira oceanica]